MLNIKYCPGNKKFKNKLVKKLRNIIDKDTIIVCIGSANVYGDSLGPRVGSTLKELNFPLTVLGTMENPINAVNFSEQYKLISDNYKDKKIIAIDASCGTTDELGCINLKDKSIRIGRGLNKKIGSIGNYSLTGCVILKQETPELNFDMLIAEDNPLVEILINSIVGLLFRSYELGPTLIHKILKSIACHFKG